MTDSNAEHFTKHTLIPMEASLSVFLLLIVFPIFSFAADRGTCPTPLSKAAYSEAQKAAAHIQKKSSTILFLFSISDTGYVCSAEVIQGVDKKTDSEAIQSVREWHFDPAKKNGTPVPSVTITPINYQLNKHGHILLVKPSQARREGVIGTVSGDWGTPKLGSDKSPYHSQ